MRNNIQLKFLNTFAIDVCADQLAIAYHEDELLQFWRENRVKKRPVLFLGSGSNILFLEDYNGTIILNRIKGISITENKTEWMLHVGAGEKWHELVIYTINRKILGLENLAYIPGYVGAASIQNIGAYGLEFSQVCEYVDVLDWSTGEKIRFSCVECHFQYRDSIFKNHLNKYVIIFVGLKLSKNWKPVINYFELNCVNVGQFTPQKILNFIFLIRSKKLPNPVTFGNAGSFFKNPIIDFKKVCCLRKIFPSMPYYHQKNGQIKLSAGWLIENCQLKGYVLGEAAVYSKQALILINNRQMATGTEIAALAFFIYNKVLSKFNIYLKPEVRLIGRYGEINPKKIFGK